MANIYNFLKNVLLDIKRESKNNLPFLSTLLLLVTIPLPYAFNNVALVFFIISTILYYKKTNFSFSNKLVLPIILFILMVFSYLWSIDKTSTLKAIPKEIVLLILPLSFMILPRFTKIQKQKIIQYYSFSIVIFVVVFLLRAIIRYFLTNDTRVFFYHGENLDDYGLVPKLLNAIHVSVFVAIAFFYFFTKEKKSIFDNLTSVLLFGFIILLSSKNIVLVFLLLIVCYFFFFSKIANKMRLRNLIVFVILIGIIFSFGKIKERFQAEFQANTKSSLSPSVIYNLPDGVHVLSIYEAWNNEKFTQNDYFPGTAFRVYQFRMFLELVKKDFVFINGFGLNASQPKLQELADKYGVYKGVSGDDGYGAKNFHNQYIQIFSELGILGFILLLVILYFNLKKALKTKDFIHISFAVIMISLFLTESFLWRQRGVVFFTILYCLFNMPEKKIEKE
jgi:O-antigen ligase